jgi:biotin carboxylase
LNSTRKTVLVLDPTYQALAIVRSVAKLGLSVAVGLPPGTYPVAMSRYVDEVWKHPDVSDVDAFCAALQSFLAQRPNIAAIFPAGERYRLALIESGLTFTQPIVGVPEPLFRTCRDKVAANDLAQRAGLRVPSARVLHRFDEIAPAAADIGYPVILKPYRNTSLIDGRKAVIVESPEQLLTKLSGWPKQHTELIVQEYISGAVESADFVARNGELVAYCEATTLRTDQLDGTGYGVLFRSLAPADDLLRATREFAEHTCYSGPGLIQFIRSSDDGNIYFLENNPRLSAGVSTSMIWGQDIPAITLEVATSGLTDQHSPRFALEPQPYDYESDIYWLERDLEGYLRQRKQLSAEQRRHWRAQLRRTFQSTKHHVIWQFSDPLPSLLIFTRIALRWLRNKY